MNIQDRILDYLKAGNTLTAKQAQQIFGTQRLGAYIHNLRKDGYDIVSVTEKGKNRYGDKVIWSKYSLKSMEKANMNHIQQI